MFCLRNPLPPPTSRSRNTLHHRSAIIAPVRRAHAPHPAPDIPPTVLMYLPSATFYRHNSRNPPLPPVRHRPVPVLMPPPPTSSNPRPSIGIRPALHRWKVTDAGMVCGRPSHPRPAPHNLLPSSTAFSSLPSSSHLARNLRPRVFIPPPTNLAQLNPWRPSRCPLPLHATTAGPPIVNQGLSTMGDGGADASSSLPHRPGLSPTSLSSTTTPSSPPYLTLLSCSPSSSSSYGT